MTVCIAAGCAKETIIAISDMMISTGMFASDNMALKFRDIHRRWNVMFAGNDISRITPLVTNAAKNMKLRGEKPSLQEVETVMKLCFRKELIQKQTDLILARYGLTMKEFLDTG